MGSDVAEPLPDTIAGRRVVAMLSQRSACSTFMTRRADGRREVVKLHATTAGSEAMLSRCRRLSTLAHARIVPLQEVHPRAEGGWLAVRRYVEGDSLADLLQQGAPDRELAVEILAPVLDALQHAHLCGIAHGALTPSNILIDNAGAAHLADFQLGCGEHRQQAQGARGENVEPLCRCCEPADDLRSAGIVLYQLLTGERLRDDPQGLERARAKLANQASGLERICLKCLDDEPRRGYSSAGDLLCDLRAGDVAPAPAPASPEPARPPLHERASEPDAKVQPGPVDEGTTSDALPLPRWPIWLAVAIAITLALFGAAWLFG